MLEHALDSDWMTTMLVLVEQCFHAAESEADSIGPQCAGSYISSATRASCVPF